MAISEPPPAIARVDALLTIQKLVLAPVPAAGVVQVGVPPVLSRVCPDVPIARHTGTPRLDATSIAPLVGILHAGIDDAVEYVSTAPLDGTASHEGVPAAAPVRIPPLDTTDHDGPMLPLAVLYANTAPLVGAARTVVTPADETVNNCPLLPIIQAGAEVPEL